MREEEFYSRLVERYVENKATEEELEVFEYLLKQGKLDEALSLSLKKQAEASNEDVSNVRKTSFWQRIAVAASIIVVLSVPTYVLLNHSNSDKAIAHTQDKRLKNDIPAPQEDKAVLTLDDGSTIVLASVVDGKVTREGKVDVFKHADGKIAYKDNNSSSFEEIKYNTITVPKGSKPFQLQLADGSQAWLNVASSITYPTSFIGKERKVKITGEVYFEITHDSTKSFIVSTGQTSVQVLGTHFNVNAYGDEPDIKVTLFEGAVDVKSQESEIKIKPGEQAVVDVNGRLAINKDADLSEAIAWKNGRFEFNNADLPTVMRQVSRWYDVDVVYQGQTEFHFGGQIARTSSLTQICKILETSGVRFSIDGKNVTVLP